MQQTPDGGYVLGGGTEDVAPSGELTLVPWLAKASADGALLWQQDYYQILTRTGNALTEYLPATAHLHETARLAAQCCPAAQALLPEVADAAARLATP
jgi:hypothetical protein